MITDNVQSCPLGASCTMYGAGLYLWGFSGGAADLSDVTIRGNTMSATTDQSASGYGAGVCAQYMALRLTNAVIEDNHLDVSANSPLAFGGGVLLKFQDTTLQQVLIAGNTIASGDAAEGAGLQMESAVLDATNVVIAGNTGTSTRGTMRGGALYARETTLNLTNVDVVGNGCPSGTCKGAAFNLYTTVDLIARSMAMVSNGPSGSSGGAVYSDFGNVTIDAAWSDFWDNGGSPFSGVTTPSAESGNLFVDPLYTDLSAPDAWDWNLDLSAGSPAMDAGDPSVLDVDGSRADIGSHGGPGGAW